MRKDATVYEYLKANPPTSSMIERTIEGATHVSTDEWELVLVPVEYLNPTEGYLDPEGPPEGMVDDMKDDPASFPPILVSGQEQSYDIIDGHHRYKAARRAGVGWLWALNANWYPN